MNLSTLKATLSLLNDLSTWSSLLFLIITLPSRKTVSSLSTDLFKIILNAYIHCYIARVPGLSFFIFNLLIKDHIQYKGVPFLHGIKYIKMCQVGKPRNQNDHLIHRLSNALRQRPFPCSHFTLQTCFSRP